VCAAQSAAGASQGGSARLMRFAAALRLDARHRQALLQSAIARNMAVGNYGCAGAALHAANSACARSGPCAVHAHAHQECCHRAASSLLMHSCTAHEHE
jgi:hypothetical protein